MFFGKRKTLTEDNIEAVLPLLERMSEFLINTEPLSREKLQDLPDKKMIIRFQCLQSYIRGVIDALSMCALSNAKIIKLRNYEHLKLDDKTRKLHTDAVSILKDIVITSNFYKSYFISTINRDNPLSESYQHSSVEFDSSAIKYPGFMSLGIDHVMSPVLDVLREQEMEFDMMGLVSPVIRFKMTFRWDDDERDIASQLKKVGA